MSVSFTIKNLLKKTEELIIPKNKNHSSYWWLMPLSPSLSPSKVIMAIRMITIRKNNSATQILGTVLVAALFFFLIQSAGVVTSLPAAAVVRDDKAAVGELKPFGVVGNHEHELMKVSSTRRLLGPFQVCLSCRCCVSAADPATCSTMPCCFGIDCQLPNKPYGVCAFVPKTCNCTYCAF